MERTMRSLFSAVFLIATLAAVPATAGRPVTDAERASLAAAVAAQGCSGGKMEWDEKDQHFEVDEATCGDGRKHELKFDKSFQMIRREADDDDD
jgi:hypothetical protein